MRHPLEILGQSLGVAVFFAVVSGVVYLFKRATGRLDIGELKVSMRDVVREVDALLQGRPDAKAVRPAILAELKSRERGILAQMRHGKTTAAEVAANFASKILSP
jgi:hypothetical protein